MNRKQLIQKYLNFFKSKNHKEIPNHSLIPENDPTVLFTTAGMHPIVPFLLGEKHPLGKRLVNVQRCIRTGDIEDVGDSSHLTFFEMLGNWSLGDYWKKEAIPFTFEFHTKILKIPLERYAVTCFLGNKNAEKDTESSKIWESLGVSRDRIAFLESDNWWGPAGKTGPCGPCTEQFFWKDNSAPAPKKFNPEDKRWVEIGNDVLMQYIKDEKGNYNLAKQKNIDFGGGVERTIAILSNKDIYETDSFKPIIEKIEELSKQSYETSTKAYMRIIADHIKASVFIIADGIVPSNTEQGYVLRKLIRRAIRYGHILGIHQFTKKVAEPVFDIYNDYEILKKNKKNILEELEKEEIKFERTLKEGLKMAQKIFNKKTPLDPEKDRKMRTSEGKTIEKVKWILDNKKRGKKYSLTEFGISEKEIDNALITKQEAFYLYQSCGFPKDMLLDLAIEQHLLIDSEGFDEEQQRHQELSRTAAEGKFKSGLADNSESTTKLHTATHLLNQALREVLNKPDLHQKGSNITPERLRFDFNFDRKLTEDEIKKVEAKVNEKIRESLPVKCEEKSVEEAKKFGAQGIFENKYGEKVKVYSIGSFSKEICAGPHVSNTKELGKFKILKEEASAAGVRRIKAELLDESK